jgi:hypothetical protein
MDFIQRSLQLSRVAAATILNIQAATHQWLVYLDDKDPSEKENNQKTTFEQRLKWDTYVANNKHKPLFKRHLRMSYDSFCTLLRLISPKLKEVDSRMADLRGGEVIVKELGLYATIRYLAGASYSDICFSNGSP